MEYFIVGISLLIVMYKDTDDDYATGTKKFLYIQVIFFAP